MAKPNPDAREGGWIRKMLMWDFNEIAMCKFPGWDKESDGYPPRVLLHLTNKVTQSSDRIAAEWDDLAAWRFYSRDISLDGSVFVCDGDRYDAVFYFERRSDRDRFHAKYGGEVMP